MRISEFQQIIDKMYSDKDRRRGPAGTFIWFVEEVGELASAIANPNTEKSKLAEEFADVFAWLATLANVEDIDLKQACKDKYAKGCPGCGQMVCRCNEKP